MTGGELAAAIERALGEVPFEPPISVPYCVALHNYIIGEIGLQPDGVKVSVEVYHRHRDLVIETWVGPAHCKRVVGLD